MTDDQFHNNVFRKRWRPERLFTGLACFSIMTNVFKIANVGGRKK